PRPRLRRDRRRPRARRRYRQVAPVARANRAASTPGRRRVRREVMTTDDDLHEFDLTAWEAPPPPAGLAEAVLARARAAAPVAALESEPRGRRWWIAGAALGAVAVAAIALVVALGGS